MFQIIDILQTDLSVSVLLALFVITFVGGVIDSISGGGGFFTVPPMVILGVPVHTALGTSKVVSIAGATGFINYARQGQVPWKLVPWCAPMIVLGTVIGVNLALYAPANIMEKVILFAFPLLFLTFFKKDVQNYAQNHHFEYKNMRLKAACVSLLVGIQDGFYAPGAGTIAIILYALILNLPKVQIVALMKTNAIFVAVSAVILFGIHGEIDWLLGIVMGAGFAIGSYIGSHMAMRKGDVFIHRLIILSSIILIIAMVYRVFFL